MAASDENVEEPMAQPKVGRMSDVLMEQRLQQRNQGQSFHDVLDFVKELYVG